MVYRQQSLRHYCHNSLYRVTHSRYRIPHSYCHQRFLQRHRHPLHSRSTRNGFHPQHHISQCWRHLQSHFPSCWQRHHKLPVDHLQPPRHHRIPHHRHQPRMGWHPQRPTLPTRHLHLSNPVHHTILSRGSIPHRKHHIGPLIPFENHVTDNYQITYWDTWLHTHTFCPLTKNKNPLSIQHLTAFSFFPYSLLCVYFCPIVHKYKYS